MTIFCGRWQIMQGFRLSSKISSFLQWDMLYYIAYIWRWINLPFQSFCHYWYLKLGFKPVKYYHYLLLTITTIFGTIVCILAELKQQQLLSNRLKSYQNEILGKHLTNCFEPLCSTASYSLYTNKKHCICKL